MATRQQQLDMFVGAVAIRDIERMVMGWEITPDELVESVDKPNQQDAVT